MFKLGLCVFVIMQCLGKQCCSTDMIFTVCLWTLVTWLSVCLLRCLFVIAVSPHQIAVIHTTWDNSAPAEKLGWFFSTNCLSFHLVCRSLLKSSFPFKSHSHLMVRVCAPRHPESLMMRVPFCGKVWPCVSCSGCSLLINSRSSLRCKIN